MSVWLDLMATPKSRLGTLELYGDTLIPEAARQVVSYIAHKYDPSVGVSLNSANKKECQCGSGTSRYYLSQYSCRCSTPRP